MKKLAAIILCLCFLFSGCSASAPGREKLKVDSDELQFRAPGPGDTVARIDTDRGVIKVVLYPQVAPIAVQNFVLLAQSGYYDGVIFHRAIEDFLIQSGSPDGSPGGGSSVWGLGFSDEFSDLLHHYSGALAMANSGPGTNGSQFYFVTTPIGRISDEKKRQMKEAGWRDEVIDAYRQAGGEPRLDYRYTVFGQIYDGLDVAYSISRSKTDEADRPVDDIKINGITVTIIE